MCTWTPITNGLTGLGLRSPSQLPTALCHQLRAVTTKDERSPLSSSLLCDVQPSLDTNAQLGFATHDPVRRGVLRAIDGPPAAVEARSHRVVLGGDRECRSSHS